MYVPSSGLLVVLVIIALAQVQGAPHKKNVRFFFEIVNR
jgi:hypothetical protein